MVEMDIIECKQILYNILSNATKYITMKGKFSLTLSNHNNNVIIEIYNDAVIDDIDFSRVFDLFYNVDKKDGSGTGVGLYTVQVMVDLYHGTYDFYPQDDGVCLVITLPVLNEN